MTDKTIVGGLPIECLSGEAAVIWSGWRNLGNRELVREASAKGTHVDLAYKCLGYRRNVSIEEAKSYFAKEVEIWIMELLQKHQVYRASHILKNVGRNPIEYVFDVCIKSKDPALRNYLSMYMINVDRFQSEHSDSWNLITSIIEFEQKYVFHDTLSSSVSIHDILKLPVRVKQALCTELYFSTTECQKLKVDSGPVLWEYLLSNDRFDLLQSWIDIHFNSVVRTDDELVDDNYKTLFQSLKITSEMTEYIDTSYASNLVKELTKNHLCRYGVFVQKELRDTRLILSRIFGSAITLDQFDEIQSLASCSIDKAAFQRKVDEELCLAYCLDETASEQTKSKLKELYRIIGTMCDTHKYNEEALIQGIFESIHYITDDIDKFLKENYLIVLALVFLYLHSEKNETDGVKRSLKEIFSSQNGLDINDYHISYQVLQHALKETPILEDAIEGNAKKEHVTMYDLIDGYRNLNAKRLYKWRLDRDTMPTFSNENLVKKYGHAESLSYGYYLKEGRPNMAIYNIMHANGKVVGTLSSRRKSKAALQAHMLALKALDKPEVICSCISFIEMLGVSSENLRLHVTAANYVQEGLNIPIGHLLEGIIYRNENDLKAVIAYLESSFDRGFKENFTKDCQTFCDAMQTWEVIVKFNRAHCYPLPQSFLLALAEQNRWFEFILVCDICAYPVNQVLECAKSFEDALLREHLQTCLKHAELVRSQWTQAEQKSKYRESRQSSYSKTESKQNESLGSIGSPMMSPKRNNSEPQSPAFVEYGISNDNTCSEEDDLWMTILKCHQSPDPPTALISAARLTLRPILTILATCYEPSSTPAYCYSWIAISSADKNILSCFKECLDYQIWSAQQVSDLLDKMILSGFTATLSRGFSIFMPDCCLNPFFEFLSNSVSYSDFKAAQRSLYYFKTQSTNMKSNNIMDWDSFDTTYITNLYWISVIAIKCIITTLGHCLKSSHLQTKFLEVLNRCNFDVDLPVEMPDFRCLVQITKTLQNTNIMFNFKAYTLTDNVYNFDGEIGRCINELLAQEDYNNALELVTAAGLNAEELILTQCRSEFKRAIEKSGRVETDFWNDCASHFAKYNISWEKATEFLVEHVEKMSSHKERYEILRLAFETIKDNSTDKRTIDTFEMAMWKSCILAKPQDIQFDAGDRVFNKLKTELLSGLSSLQTSCTLDNEHEREATKALIDRLIDLGRLDVALRISTIFNYDHKDLEVLMLCLTLAEGETLPSDLTPEQRSLFPDSSRSKQQKFGGLKNRGLRRLSSSSSLSSSLASPTSTTESIKTRDERFYKVQQDCLSMLISLREVLEHGADICSRVLLCYKLAVKLDQPYQLLLRLNNPIEFLQETIDSNIDNKLEISSDIIAAYKISGENVAIYLTENILATITQTIEEGYDDVISLWGYPLNSNFHAIMELCSDVSLLGWQLLKKARTLLGPSHGGKRNVATLKTVVELIIRSHDCFTTACNMEGIAAILRKSQNLANILQTLRHWTILVRLVTGVGRFTEMSYVFQILKENDQFEFLLGKGLDKASGLKMALLEFLKRQCPENKELFTLVALHFRLYHEIALMWENEAKDVIKALITSAARDRDKFQYAIHEVKLIRTENVQKQLQLAVTNYTHATQYYLQDNKLNLASRCSDQAQLVSLQLYLLDATTQNQQVACILNLKSDEIDKILCHLLNFSQALVVIRAYNYHVDWTNLIYSHTILNGETKYLKDFTSVIKLTPNLVQDCARRYRLEKSITHKMTSNMKLLITELTDSECKYAMASQLGFKDIVEVMLNDPLTGAYLKDTVWKKGYNSTS